jgi:RHS repeat-associated protein
MRHTDASQVVQNTYEYDAWGTPYVATEGASTKQQYRMSQKELDPDAVAFNSQNSRYHFPARTYIPLRANFIQIDPLAIGNPGSKRALYLYVMANPLVMVDPDGRNPAITGLGINIVDPNVHGWGIVNVRTVILSSFMVRPALGANPFGVGGGSGLGWPAINCPPNECGGDPTELDRWYPGGPKFGGWVIRKSWGKCPTDCTTTPAYKEAFRLAVKELYENGSAYCAWITSGGGTGTLPQDSSCYCQPGIRPPRDSFNSPECTTHNGPYGQYCLVEVYVVDPDAHCQYAS